MDMLIDGELCDTYGGDFTYKYVGYTKADDGTLRFYEWYLGAREHDWGNEPEEVYDEKKVADYKGILDGTC